MTTAADTILMLTYGATGAILFVFAVFCAVGAVCHICYDRNYAQAVFISALGWGSLALFAVVVRFWHSVFP